MTRKPAEILFKNAHLLSPDVVTQVAVNKNRIIAVGDDLSNLQADETEVYDLDGSILAPGFIDSHLHFLWGGQGLLSIPIQDARSKDDFIRIIREYRKQIAQGDWIQGNGWNENLFHENLLPHKAWLDQAAPGNPILLIRHDGHSAIANSLALKIAGIDNATPDPMGGVIDRDGHGEATGILRDSAITLVEKHTPSVSWEELEQHLEAAQDYLLKRGITSICDMIHDLDHFRFLQAMAKTGKLKVRVTAYLPILKWPEIKALIDSGIYQDEWLQFKGLKGFCDGSLGSHTALMLEPYEDSPESIGIYDSDWQDPELIKEIIKEADEQGLQVLIHAIGDRANHEVLNVFQDVINLNGHRDRRFRVEHAQHVHPDDQRRFAELGVIASMQPAHCLDDSLYAEKLLGDRCNFAFPFKSLLSSNAILALGSDWPVSPADPILSIHAAIHRNQWYLSEALNRMEATDGYHGKAAYSIFREDELGTIKVGALADLVILKSEFLKLETIKNIPENLIQRVFINGNPVNSMAE